MTPLEQARHIVTTYSGIVSEFVSRGRVPRELTREEKRQAVDDVAAFEKTVATIQREQLDLMRDEAAWLRSTMPGSQHTSARPSC